MTALVLLPGMDGTGDLFAPLLSALPPALRTIVVRYPCDRPLGYAELEAHARRALPKDQPFVLLGESFSGPIAAAIAAAPPPGLRGLILCATFLRNPRPELGYARFLTGLLPVSLLPGVLLVRMLLGPRADPGLRTQLLDAVSRVEDRVMRARLRAVIDVDAGPRMSGVTLPVLYLSARDDRVVPRRAGDHVMALIPQARRVEIAAPHCLLQTAPQEAARAIMDFIGPAAP